MMEIDLESIVAKLHEGAVAEVRELDTVWSRDVETQRLIVNLRLALILARERQPDENEPKATHGAIVTTEQARMLLIAGARWLGSTEADPRNA
jgi:hypothetical protein